MAWPVGRAIRHHRPGVGRPRMADKIGRSSRGFGGFERWVSGKRGAPIGSPAPGWNTRCPGRGRDDAAVSGSTSGGPTTRKTHLWRRTPPHPLSLIRLMRHERNHGRDGRRLTSPTRGRRAGLGPQRPGRPVRERAASRISASEGNCPMSAIRTTASAWTQQKAEAEPIRSVNTPRLQGAQRPCGRGTTTPIRGPTHGHKVATAAPVSPRSARRFGRKAHAARPDNQSRPREGPTAQCPRSPWRGDIV